MSKLKERLMTEGVNDQDVVTKDKDYNPSHDDEKK